MLTTGPRGTNDILPSEVHTWLHVESLIRRISHRYGYAELRPPVFEKEWPAFSRAVRDWRGPALQRTIARLYEAEKSCKQAGAPSDAIIRNLIHRIATRTI